MAPLGLEDVGWFLVQKLSRNFHFCACLIFYVADNLFLNGNLRRFSRRWPHLKAPELLTPRIAREWHKPVSDIQIWLLKGNAKVQDYHQILGPIRRPEAWNCSLASRSHFQIFYSDIYWKGILETFTRLPNSALELLLLLLAVIFRYSTVIYTWIFENRVNLRVWTFSRMFPILTLSLKDTVSKLLLLKQSFFTCRLCFFTFCSNL